MVNKLRGTLKVVAVKAPGFGERKTSYLEDIAILTGELVCLDRFRVVGGRLDDACKAVGGRMGDACKAVGRTSCCFRRRPSSCRTAVLS